MAEIYINLSTDDAMYNRHPHAYKLANMLVDVLTETIAPPVFVKVFTPVAESYLAANNLYRIEVNVKRCLGAVYASGEAVEQMDTPILATGLAQMIRRKVDAVPKT